MPLTETLTVENDGLTLDLLLWRRFRRSIEGQVERTLDINPGLASFVALPIGRSVTVEVPAPVAQTVKQVISLWD